MAKITLTDFSGSVTVSELNTNLQALEDALNNDVLYRNNPVGETNTMSNDLDMNSNSILNVPTPTASTDVATKAYVDGLAGFSTATGLAQAVTDAQTAQTAAETAQTAAETAETNAETAETNAAASAASAAASVADAVLKSTSGTITVGHVTDTETLSSNVITPDLTLEAIKTRAVDGNVSIALPTGGNGVCHIILTADASGPYTVTLGSGVKAVGTIPNLSASTTYIATVVRHTASLAAVQIQEISA